LKPIFEAQSRPRISFYTRRSTAENKPKRLSCAEKTENHAA